MKSATKQFLRFLLSILGVFLLAIAVIVISGLRDRIGHADVALVLGSKVEMNGVPSPRLRSRLDRTVELYRAGYFPLIIVSGGTGKEGFDESVVMRDYLVQQGIPRDGIWVDGKGDTTFASARNAYAMLRDKNVRDIFVITQYFHIPRASLALRRAGFTSVGYSHSRWFEWRDIYSAPREVIGYVYYLFRHTPGA